MSRTSAERPAAEPFRRAGALAAALACLTLAAGSLLVGHGEFELALAGDRLDRWWQTRDRALLATAERQLARAGAALRRGELASRRGEAALIRGLLDDAAGQPLREAEAHFTTAIRARPTWPPSYAWRAIARARLRHTAGMRRDLARALILGPNSGSTLALLAPHAGVVMPRVDTSTRRSLVALAGRMARGNGSAAAALAERLGVLGEWCRLPGVAERAARTCRPFVPTT